MQVVIPMTGYGSRFKSVGYAKLKPFIEVIDKPMIEWIVSMFNKESDNFTFIVRSEHYNSLNYMKEVLNNLVKNYTIFQIDNWEKKGPVNDVFLATSSLNSSEPICISYCDYYMLWDYENFCSEVKKRDCDGAIPCYSGFHPNLLPVKNMYASCKVDSNDNLIEIREKYSFTKDKTKSRHSPGLYYFKNLNLLQHYYKQTLTQNSDSINGEFYSSLVYNHLVKDNLKVWAPINVTHFCQWGTPEDLEEFNFYIDSIRGFV